MRWMDFYGHGNLKNLFPIIRNTNIFVFESGPGLFLFKRFRKENPSARMVYRVSDDIRILGSTHPRLIEFEREIISDFDYISVPSSTMLSMFPGTHVTLDRHGLDKQAYDDCIKSPYTDNTHNAIFVGTGYMDTDFLQAAAVAYPQCLFHIIGPMTDRLHINNVHFLGEMPFKETLPYVKFADVGLGIRTFRKGYASTLTDSLKIIQYRYCGLPIVSPDFLDLHRDGVFYYTPGNADSCVQAMGQALQHGCHAEYAAEVHSWDEVARRILEESVPSTSSNS